MYNFYFCNFIWYGCKKLSNHQTKNSASSVHFAIIPQCCEVLGICSGYDPDARSGLFCQHPGSQASVSFFVWFPFITFCGLWSAMEWSLNKFHEESSGTGRFLVALTPMQCVFYKFLVFFMSIYITYEQRNTMMMINECSLWCLPSTALGRFI